MRSLIIISLVAFVGLAFTTQESSACEPRHELKFEPGEPECGPGEVLCDRDPTSGDPINCVPCGEDDQVPGGLCWASNCRTFGGGDKGYFAQFKKSARGELEAIVMTITNHDTGVDYTLVDSIANPTCPIPAEDSAGLECGGIYKVKNIHPDGAGNKSPLCTWGNLDDVNTITTTPKSQGLQLVDLNNQSCTAVKKAGTVYWLYYKDCCSPVSAFGSPGDRIETEIDIIVNDGGTCGTDSIRVQHQPEDLPGELAEPCL